MKSVSRWVIDTRPFGHTLEDQADGNFLQFSLGKHQSIFLSMIACIANGTFAMK